MQIYEEGKARIVQGSDAFLNPNMSKLRDISVLFLTAFGAKGKTVLDSTAATGIRGIRYKLEAKAGETTFLDINAKVYAALKSNLKRNKIKGSALNKSVQEYTNSGVDAFDIIDLDPFGSPAPYVFDILKVSKGETLLMVTATDTAVLCGAHAAACVKQYNAKPMHNELCKEAGVRILAGFVARTAAQFNFGIELKLSIADMHYMRIFVVLKRGAKIAVDSMKELGYLASCGSCKAFYISKGLVPSLDSKCANCKGTVEKAGPMWLGNLYDKEIVSKMLTVKSVASKESIAQVGALSKELDIPFFYSIPAVTKSLRRSSVSPRIVIEKLNTKGYQSMPTQFDQEGVKTTAPVSEILGIIKAI